MIHHLECTCGHCWRQGAFTHHMPHVPCPKCGGSKIKAGAAKLYDPDDLDRKEETRRLQIITEFTPKKQVLKLREHRGN